MKVSINYLYAIILIFIITAGLVFFMKPGEYGKAVTVVETQPDYMTWEEAQKKGIMPDPGYGIPEIPVDGDDIIITYPEEPKAVIYQPPPKDYPKISLPGYGGYVPPAVPKPTETPAPVTIPAPSVPSLEEQGRLRVKGKYTCYYDENGKFVRAWRTYGSGDVVILEGDARPSDCPAKVAVKKEGYISK